MILTFTGTRSWLTPAQLEGLKKALVALMAVDPITEVHHGSCIGADEHFDLLCQELGLYRVVHPSCHETWRIHVESRPGFRGHVEAAAEPLVRNRFMVRLADVVVACPATQHEIVRSGTWATVRTARSLRGPAILTIRPDGTMEGWWGPRTADGINRAVSELAAPTLVKD